MRYFIDEVEIYPEYHPKLVLAKTAPGAGLAISPALMARYEAALQEWGAVQDELGELLEQSEQGTTPTA
ncbi:hypothetical protein [Streptomyces spinosirectus]